MLLAYFMTLLFIWTKDRREIFVTTDFDKGKTCISSPVYVIVQLKKNHSFQENVTKPTVVTTVVFNQMEAAYKNVTPRKSVF